MLLKHPGFTLIAVLTLALGIGANTAIFSIVNAVLLRPFPYHAPEQLVMIGEVRAWRFGVVSQLCRLARRSQRSSMQHPPCVQTRATTSPAQANPNACKVGLSPRVSYHCLVSSRRLGRDFLAEDDRPGATPAVILSYGFWSRRFGNDPNIIGKQITLNNQSYTVVGITPRDFQFGLDADVTVPIGLSAERFKARGSDPGISVVARLKPNVSLEQAETELNLIYARMEQQYPGEQHRAARVSDAIARKFCWRRSTAAVDLAWRRRPGPIDRLRKCRQSPARPRVYAKKRDVCARCAWRESLAHHSSTTYRKLLLAASAPCWEYCSHSGARVLSPTQLPDGIPRLQKRALICAVLAFHARRLAPDRIVIRASSGIASFASESDGGVERRRPRFIRRPPAPAQCVSGLRSRSDAHAVSGRRFADSKLPARDAGSSRLRSAEPAHDAGLRQQP